MRSHRPAGKRPGDIFAINRLQNPQKAGVGAGAPRNPVGKILKRVLKEKIEDAFKRPVSKYEADEIALAV